MDPTDQLAAVRAELHNRRARSVADELGIAYDTVLRIRRGQCTPRYDTLHALYTFLFHRSSLPVSRMEASAKPAAVDVR